MKPETPLARYVRTDVNSIRVARIWEQVEARLDGEPPKASNRSWAWGAMGAALAAGAAAASAVLFMAPADAPVESTAVVQSAFQRAVLKTASDTLTVDLKDGSRIELAANTRVSVLEGNGTIVEVQLEQGKVDCDLIPKPDRRFAVFAEGVEVRVTGTKFSVQLQDNRQVDVAVERGSVEVTRPPLRRRSNSGGNSTPSELTETTRTLEAGERWSVQLEGAEPVVELPDDTEVLPKSEDAGIQAVPSSSALPPKTSPGKQGTGKPLTAKELLDQANAARRDGDARGAARAYETLLTKHGRDARAGLAAFELGRLRMDRLGDIKGAVRALKQAVALAPGSGFREDAMARLVRAYAAMNAMKSCRAARKSYLASYPKGVHAEYVSRSCGGR